MNRTFHDERSRKVHENKQKYDKFTEKEDEIYTKLNDILHKDICILLKSSDFLLLYLGQHTQQAPSSAEVDGNAKETTDAARIHRKGFGRIGCGATRFADCEGHDFFPSSDNGKPRCNGRAHHQ
jgi:hypothetical protein